MIEFGVITYPPAVFPSCREHPFSGAVVVVSYSPVLFFDEPLCRECGGALLWPNATASLTYTRGAEHP